MLTYLVGYVLQVNRHDAYIAKMNVLKNTKYKHQMLIYLNFFPDALTCFEKA
jgi:hypothetical protein